MYHIRGSTVKKKKITVVFLKPSIVRGTGYPFNQYPLNK